MHYDRLETRAADARERAQFKDLRGILKSARTRASALRRQLQGVKVDDIKDRADLRRIPLVRKSDLILLQGEDPPFGGFTSARASTMKRLIMSAGPVFTPDAQGKDWWASARALYAAGVRRGDIVLNTFSYHFCADGPMIESGAAALGCAVIPAGPGAIEQQIEAIRHYRPRVFCGALEFLEQILDAADRMNCAFKSIEIAMVCGDTPSKSVRDRMARRGIVLRNCFVTAEAGVLAYETSNSRGGLVDGMIANEHIILEIVRTGSGDPVEPGEIGEVVVTRLTKDFPLLRFATGELSAFVDGDSPCGRTNLRLRGPLGPAPGWVARNQSVPAPSERVAPSAVQIAERDNPAVAGPKPGASRSADERPIS